MIADRVFFIEKSPRVRIAPPSPGRDGACDRLNWQSGPKGCGQECGDYQPSRDWCDARLVELGYVLEDDHGE